jgi:hypothetical protein
MTSSHTAVIPANTRFGALWAGIQLLCDDRKATLDSRLRGNDGI